jgi:hypothetical protein
VNRHTKSIVLGLPIFVAGVIVAFAAISLITREPHVLNRGGALAAACSAGAVFFQIISEMRIEKNRKALENRAEKEDEPASLSPVSRLTGKLKERQRERQDLHLTEERLLIARSVILCAFAAELVHGFGDLAVTWLLGWFSR